MILTKLLFLWVILPTILGMILSQGLLIYLYKKEIGKLFQEKYLFRYTYSSVRSYLWTWTKDQFFSLELPGALSCVFLFLPWVQFPMIWISPHPRDYLLTSFYFVLFGMAFAYLSVMTCLKVLVKKWKPWLTQNPELLLLAKDKDFKEKALKFKTHLNASLQKSSNHVTTSKNRI